jgi:hypothetical protein
VWTRSLTGHTSLSSHDPSEDLDCELSVERSEFYAVKVEQTDQRAGASRSSGGRSWPASQWRPALPNISDTGHLGARFRAKVACTWFVRRVRWRTRCVRRATSRRSIRAWSSGSTTGGNKVRREELGQDPGVGLVGRHLRFGDGLGPARVGHHHPAHPRLDQHGNGVAGSGGFEGNLVIGVEAVGLLPESLGGRSDAALVATRAALDHRNLGEGLMDIESDRSHGWLVSMAS